MSINNLIVMCARACFLHAKTLYLPADEENDDIDDVVLFSLCKAAFLFSSI